MAASMLWFTLPCGVANPVRETIMRRIVFVIAVVVLCVVGAVVGTSAAMASNGVGVVAPVADAGYHRHFHVHQVSLSAFVVTCDNGADPTIVGGSSSKNEIMVSCGKYSGEAEEANNPSKTVNKSPQ